MACNDCGGKDKNGNWLKEPCCNYMGICDAGDEKGDLGMCIHCGAEMFKENGEWFHHTQMEIPYKQRGTKHYGS